MDTHTRALFLEVATALLLQLQDGGVAARTTEPCVTKEGFRGFCSSKTMCPGEVRKLMEGASVTMCPYDSLSYKLCCPLPHDNDIPGGPHDDPLSCITQAGHLGICIPKARCPAKTLRSGGDITQCPSYLFRSSSPSWVCCPLLKQLKSL